MPGGREGSKFFIHGEIIFCMAIIPSFVIASPMVVCDLSRV
jgi:hypothetical protein